MFTRWRWFQRGMILIAVPLLTQLCFIGFLGLLQNRVDQLVSQEQHLDGAAAYQDLRDRLCRLLISGTALAFICSLVVCRDLGERRQTEETVRETSELLQLLRDKAVDYALLWLDPDGRVIDWNAGAERLKGYRKEEIVGKHFSCFFPPELVRRGWPQEELRLALANGKCEDEGWRVRKDGSRFWANVVITPLRTETGQLKGFAKLTRDLSERRRAEQALNQLNEQLEQRVRERTAELASANRELAQKNHENETFVYSVSHDLRSPLVNLEGFSKELGLVGGELRELLEDPALPQGVRQRGLALLDGDMAEAIRFIQTNVLRLSKIIDALLRLSRAGRVVYQWQPIEVRDVIDRIVTSMAATILQRKASVRVQELPAVWGDPTAVDQIFANLIGNALNYLDEKRPGVIEVGCTTALGTGPDRHTFYVKDNGLGIPASSQSKIFQAFQRIHPGAAKGEGVGLTLVQRLVARHGGTIWFESKENVGTTFFVTLPAPREPSVPETSAPRASAEEVCHV